jgi:glucose-1-phosphate cytidylyltransferase
VKAVILSGGRGTQTEHGAIGGKPVAWHLMNRLARFGIDDFVVCGRPVEPLEPGWHVVTVDAAYLKQAEPYVDGEMFVLADSRGLADVDLDAVIAYANQHGRLATVTAVRLHDEYVSAGVFVLRRGVFDYLTVDDELEHEPLVALAADAELFAFRHEGFWHPLASDRDWIRVNELWASGRAPWAA